MGPQAPPTRGPTPAAPRARRPARGSLPWTTGTSYRRGPWYIFTPPLWPIITPPLTLFPTAALSKVFRGKYLDFLGAAYRDGELRLKAAADGGDDGHEFECLKTALRSHDWVVYSKAPFAGAKQVLAYLGRYTHKIAISNHRLVDFDGEHVRFRWRDYADSNKVKVMRLDADEFIRRFLLHVLPRSFTRLRHYGLLANRCRARKLSLCRELLGQLPPEPGEPETADEMMLRLTGIDITACQQCGEGTLRQVLVLEPHHCTGMATMKTGPP